MFKKLLLVPLVLLALGGICAAQYPVSTEGDFVIKDFRFTSGEMLPELRVHYRTLGKPQRDAQGVVRNAVLIIHGTGGLPGSCLSPGGCWMPNATSSSCRMVSAMAAPASRAMGSVADSRTTGTST